MSGIVRAETLRLTGTTAVRPRGSLRVAPARELHVTGALRAAFEPDGTPARDTPRVWGVDGVDALTPDPVPDVFPARDTAPEICDEPVVWGGGFLHHYGHFLTECVARLWPLLPGGELEGTPAVFTTPLDAPRAHDWADAFGLRTLAVPADRAVRFTRMAVPDPAWRLNAWIAPEIRDIHLRVRQGLDVPAKPARDVLWLSRAKVRSSRRGAHDQCLLEWLLSEHVTVAHPEQMTLGEQLGAIEASDVVAGFVGSAFHTLLMAAELPRCLYLCPAKFQSAHVAQNELLGIDAEFVHALALVEPRPATQPRFPGGYRVLIPEALRALGDSVVPSLRDDPRTAALMCPERFRPPPGRASDDLDVAIAAMLLDPFSLTARTRLGTLLEAAGLERCAREQFATVATLAGEDPSLRSPA